MPLSKGGRGLGGAILRRTKRLNRLSRACSCSLLNLKTYKYYMLIISEHPIGALHIYRHVGFGP